MVCAVKMLGGVLVLRRVAATYMTTFQAQAKVNPAITHLHALGANVSIGIGHFD
jgi:hypothetical protein